MYNPWLEMGCKLLLPIFILEYNSKPGRLKPFAKWFASWGNI
jgi:hypothetical protein